MDGNEDTNAEELRKGIREFNAGLMFECHETLEALWKTQLEPEKTFTQGIIQIAVGYYHLGRDNRQGATKLLSRGLARIKPFAPTHRGVDVESLMEAVSGCLSEIANQKSGDAPPSAPTINLSGIA